MHSIEGNINILLLFAMPAAAELPLTTACHYQALDLHIRIVAFVSAQVYACKHADQLHLCYVSVAL